MKELKLTTKKVIEMYPRHAIDLVESLELVKDTVNETINSINDEIEKLTQKRNYAQLNDYASLGEKLDQHEHQITKLIEMLDIEEYIENEENEEDEVEEEERRKIPDYGAYAVESHVEHTLYEDFTHKRPFGFKLNDDRTIEVQTWKEMLIKVCEILYLVDQRKIKEFENIPKMNGRRKKYFSSNPSDLRKAYKVETFYVETNMNGNSIRNLVIKMLREYNFEVNYFKVFLRADYTGLHK